MVLVVSHANVVALADARVFSLLVCRIFESRQDTPKTRSCWRTAQIHLFMLNKQQVTHTAIHAHITTRTRKHPHRQEMPTTVHPPLSHLHLLTHTPGNTNYTVTPWSKIVRLIPKTRQESGKLHLSFTFYHTK